ncbi:MAG: peptidoglycan editing factor PgeF [Gammaproteobacteria bacterium]
MPKISPLSNIGQDWISPEWPAPRSVRACTTTTCGGVSEVPYESMNLATHVGDSAAAVRENRRCLMEYLELPAQPLWLEQVHENYVVNAAGNCDGIPLADASFSDHPGPVCAVLTADCLPLLLCDHAGTRVAAVHAGWRGLAAGVIEAAVAALNIAPQELMAWMGPAIGPRSFEVGDEVRDIFLQHDSAAGDAFLPAARQAAHSRRWFADIYRLAKLRLSASGVSHVYGGNFDTFSDTRFYSYRRSGVTGRMATLIWIDVN